MEREDYFFGTEDRGSRRKVYALVIYDIVDNKNRVKFAKFLNGYGNRIQKSGFEVTLSEKKYQEMIRLIPSFCREMDSIRVYRIEGKNLVHKWGIDTSVDYEDVIII